MSIHYNSFGSPILIGIDNGYGNTKTSHFCFPSGITSYNYEPTFSSNVLILNGTYYSIGDDHKDYTFDKSHDEDTYVLTLAAIAMELKLRNLTEANVHIAAGLPLTWVSTQKEAFRDYIMRDEVITYTYRGEEYCIHISEVDVFPQGFAAIAPHLGAMTGPNMICDIGNGTLNVMSIIDRKPIEKSTNTEKLIYFLLFS